MKKKIYLLVDRHGGEVMAELTNKGKLTVKMEFPRPILDEEELLGTFVELGWNLVHAEFRNNVDNDFLKAIQIPENATFH